MSDREVVISVPEIKGDDWKSGSLVFEIPGMTKATFNLVTDRPPLQLSVSGYSRQIGEKPLLKGANGDDFGCCKRILQSRRTWELTQELVFELCWAG
jgi:hypothetical protein